MPLVMDMDYRPLETFNHCKCPEKELCVRIISSGQKWLVNMCPTCYKSEAIKKSAISNSRFNELTVYSVIEYKELKASYQSKITEWYEYQKNLRYEQFERDSDEERQKYKEYLRTDKWHKKRRAVLARDEGLCQACLTRQATQVHHTTYDRKYDEPCFDLVSVCRECHVKIHGDSE